jgi:hypothetical protein
MDLTPYQIMIGYENSQKPGATRAVFSEEIRRLGSVG